MKFWPLFRDKDHRPGWSLYTVHGMEVSLKNLANPQILNIFNFTRGNPYLTFIMLMQQTINIIIMLIIKASGLHQDNNLIWIETFLIKC